MTLDLREELENATAALAPTSDLVSRARAVGHRRLVFRRLRNVLGGATVVAVLGVGIATGPPQWWQIGHDIQPGSSTTSMATDIEAALTAVSLPDPAPGFPYRIIPDPAPELITLDNKQYWSRVYSLAVKPESTVTDSDGTVSGTANGPEAVVRVGTFPLPGSGGEVDGHPIVERPNVAGTQGILVKSDLNGAAMVALYFQGGAFTVEITGIEGATTDQLIALGDALTGLEGAASSESAAMTNAARVAEAQQRCQASLALEPKGTEILFVSATTVDAVRAHRDDPGAAAALAAEPWASLRGSDTAGWCTVKAGDTYKIVAATELGASITFVSSSQPLDDPGPAGPPLP